MKLFVVWDLRLPCNCSAWRAKVCEPIIGPASKEDLERRSVPITSGKQFGTELNNPHSPVQCWIAWSAVKPLSQIWWGWPGFCVSTRWLGHACRHAVEPTSTTVGQRNSGTGLMFQTILLNWSKIEYVSRKSVIAWFWKSVTDEQTNKHTDRLTYELSCAIRN